MGLKSVQIFQTFKQLATPVFDDLYSWSFYLFEVVFEMPSVHNLGYENYLIGVFFTPNVFKIDNVFVMHSFQQLYLVFDSLPFFCF